MGTNEVGRTLTDHFHSFTERGNRTHSSGAVGGKSGKPRRIGEIGKTFLRGGSSGDNQGLKAKGASGLNSLLGDFV